MGTSQRTSGSKSSSVWPEERLREEVGNPGRRIVRKVGELAEVFGVRRLSEEALRNVERSLRTQRVFASPTPIPTDPSALVTLHYDPDGEATAWPQAVAATERASDHPRPPTEPWVLSAPESYVLRYREDGYGFEAFKLAVMELVARNALRFTPIETRVLGWRRRQDFLHDGPCRHEVTNPALLPALELYEATEKEEYVLASGEEVDGVSIERYARTATKALRPAFYPYRDGVLMRLLEDKGLANIRHSRGVFSTKPWLSRTPAGRAADDELEAWMAGGRERLQHLIDEDPARALAYAASAGPALLLMDDVAGPLAFVARDVVKYPALLPDAPAPAADLDIGILDQLNLAAFNSFDAIGLGLAGGTGGGGGCGGDGGGGGGGC